jgi:3-dehydroquinate dehydratase-2
MKVIIINGPNLNLLGKRELDIYGSVNFDDYLMKLNKKYSKFSIEYYQSNVEGEIIDKLHEVGFSYDSIILNAGGYTHTSVAILDALLAINTPVIEVHISNIYSREEFRKKSILSKAASGLVVGFGLKSYDLALASLRN